MRESALIQAVHRKLPPDLYHQSMTGASMYAGGTPDQYYDGSKDLWVEYKMLKAVPRDGIALGELSTLQKLWLERRWTHGRNAVVMVGVPNKRTALVVVQIEPAQWLGGTAICEAITVAEAAKWILEFCCGCSNR